MGLYERLLEERAEEEERHRGGPWARPAGRTPRSSTGGWPTPRRIRPRGVGAICACSIGTPARGCVVAHDPRALATEEVTRTAA